MTARGLGIKYFALTLLAYFSCYPTPIWGQDEIIPAWTLQEAVPAEAEEWGEEEESPWDWPEEATNTQSFLENSPGEFDTSGNFKPHPSPNQTLETMVIRQNEPSSACPDQPISLFISYPQGTGSKKLDQTIAKDILEKYDALMTNSADFFCDQEGLCGANKCWSWELVVNYGVYRPSRDYISILFTEHRFLEAGRSQTHLQVVNYNLTTEKPLSNSDLFTEPEKGIPLFHAYVQRKWPDLRVDPSTADQKYAPEKTEGPEVNIDQSRLVLSEFGASLLIGEGSDLIAVDLPKNELINLGMSSLIWGGQH